MTSSTIFRFRPEFPGDVQTAMSLLPQGVEVTRFEHVPGTCKGDISVTIGLTGMRLNDVRQWLAEVPDGHVMFETAALEADYTGERSYKGVEEIIALENGPGVNENDRAL